MKNTEHYFDWAATSPTDEDILKEAMELTLEAWGNPSSVHQIGKDAKALLDQARNTAAKAMGVKAENIYFTSGGTESGASACAARRISTVNTKNQIFCWTYLYRYDILKRVDNRRRKQGRRGSCLRPRIRKRANEGE